tara:strand:- start:76 stop:495 length:420 start_codon:yes stop_codon:yes gene_type:complete
MSENRVSKFQYTIKADGSKPKFKEKVSEKNFKLTKAAWNEMKASSSAAGRPGDFTSLFKAYKRMEFLESASASGVVTGEVAGFVNLKKSTDPLKKIEKFEKTPAILGVAAISTKLASTQAVKTDRQKVKDGSIQKWIKK